MFLRVTTFLTALLLALPLAARAAEPLVVSAWGGNWKDTIERLAKARVAKGNPLVDVTFTTSHVGRLYISDGLYERLDMTKIPNAKEIAREAIRSPYHLGSWA